ncbi:GTP-binding protein Rhes [Gadus macrocephalus]|uniref:GTP-binding protein Rhes n=1 Tax=Gadus macrocephalus TaxID=80720 RepID=UPI0028CB30FF|nr:GTP-binding protein Rhes [Gadus macrocephalus]
MEMNANEKLYLSAEGISEPCNSYPGHHPYRLTGGKNITHKKSESVSPNPKRSLQNKCQSQYSNSSVAISDIGATMADTGMLKTVKARWRQDKRDCVGSSSADDEKRSSSDQLQKKPVEDLPKTPLSSENSGDGTVPPGQIKPRNCRRIVVLGAPKVGKTNIVRRFLGDEFDERYVPTTEDFHRKMYHIRGKPYLIDVLDAAREREFPAKRRLSILTGDIFVLAFSLDDRDSLKEARNLRNEIISSKTTLMKSKDSPRVPIVICGNKVDLAAGRVVSRSEISEILGEDAAYYETSAKAGSGLDDVFRALVTLGGLPAEIIPSQHQTISLHTYQSLFSNQRAVRKMSSEVPMDGPCAALCASARRPSFNSDLKLVLGSSSSKNKPKKCQIQ